MNSVDQQLSSPIASALEVRRLLEENARLRRLLIAHNILIPEAAKPTLQPPKALNPVPEAQKHGIATADQRIALFRSLFRGREDIYAIRWENNDGRSGYMPKADRDWKSYLSAKDEDRKKVDRLTRTYWPLTDNVIHGHLVGEQTVGIYPLLQDETCWLLAVDFDKKAWQEDTAAFLSACSELSVPAALERSRSGKGGHVWIFFERAIPASAARKLGSVILTRTMESRHQLGLDSYDRLFPNQDTTPKGGFGNLIALPLQKIPRAIKNGVFVDAEFRPYPDQWEFLASVKRMTADAVEAVVLEAQKRGDLLGVRINKAEDEDVDPWALPPSKATAEREIPGPFPAQVQIVRSNLVYVEKNGLPPAMLNRLLRLTAFQIPEFYEAQAMRLPTFNKPRVIACGEDSATYIALPRVCIAEVKQLFEAHHINQSSVMSGSMAARQTWSSQDNCARRNSMLPPRSPNTTTGLSALLRHLERPLWQLG